MNLSSATLSLARALAPLPSFPSSICRDHLSSTTPEQANGSFTEEAPRGHLPAAPARCGHRYVQAPRLTLVAWIRVRDRSRRPEGGEWEPIKISLEIETVGLYPENHPRPQAFWPKFGIAMEKLNQHKMSRTGERNHGSERQKSADQTDLDRSDRSLRPVRPVSETG